MQAGLVDTFQHPARTRGGLAWLLSALLLVSYLLLYLGPIPALGLHLDVFQKLAEAVHLSSKWTLYGLLYTVAMILGGAYFLSRYGRNSPYQRVRTIVVVLVQIVFGFSLPLEIGRAHV